MGNSKYVSERKNELKENTKYKIKVEWAKDAKSPVHGVWNGAVQLRWAPPAQESYDGITLSSEVGDMIDYYFIYGPELDHVIDGYRTATGKVPMFGKYAYGYWHSHIDIQSQKDYLALIQEFRKRKIPLDVLVQDLNYWTPEPWGSHHFNPERYPNPKEMIAEAHKNNVHYMISVCGFFINKTDWPLLNQDEGYRELYTRWYQFGTFCPILRTHGCGVRREMWLMGNESMNTQIDFVNLRYRLLPYIYSNAGAVTHENFTIMRSLVMDFANDSKALDVKFQFMFGKAFMVCPVVEPGIKSQKCYLPQNTDWFDFWTGEKFNGGQTIERPVKLQNIPLFVRAGSIVPFGPFLQYATEKVANPLEIRVYPGADGSFTLYDDEGENYNYEKGQFSTIELTWNDADKTLIFSKIKGGFPGMLKERTFNIVLVGSGKASGIAETKNIDKQVKYNGEGIEVKF